jgi:hypothetical protein
MKNIYIKSVLFCWIIVLSSCSKETCSYVTECTPAEPEGFMVTTYYYPSIANVGSIYKTTFNSNAPIGTDWNNTALGVNKLVELNPPRWNASNIGHVFGIAIDDTGGIYLGASLLYNLDYYDLSPAPINFGSAGSAGIYKTDVATLATIDFVITDLFSNTNTVGKTTIPNSGVGLGNLVFDKKNQQLFATNLEDGRIFRIDATTGVVKSIFDPFTLDGGTAGIVNPGEQLWGIGILTENGKTSVYFARTVTATLPNNFAPGSVGTKEIWSIDLDASGEFAATEIGATKLFTDSASSSKLQIPNVTGTQAKVTDIAFSCSGKMLLAERGGPHVSKILEYVRSGATWINGSNFYNGKYSSGNNSAGGVDYGDREITGKFTKDDIVWATSNFMYFDSKVMYGVQGMSSSGNSPILSSNAGTDLFIDYTNLYTTANKGKHGDVEIFDSSCPCAKQPTFSTENN